MIRSGKYRHRVQLQKPVYTQDATGHADPSFKSVASVWCEVGPMAGREVFVSEQQRALGASLIKMRYRSDITAEWRIIHGSTTYEIAAPPINVQARNRELHIVCNSGVVTK